MNTTLSGNSWCPPWQVGVFVPLVGSLYCILHSHSPTILYVIYFPESVYIYHQYLPLHISIAITYFNIKLQNEVEYYIYFISCYYAKQSTCKIHGFDCPKSYEMSVAFEKA